MRVICVAAAIIERHGLILICQRARGTRHELKWEFPGGKVEPGETPEMALSREIEEELGVKAIVGREIYRTQYRYAEYDEPLEVVFFETRVPEGPLQPVGFERVDWVSRASLFDYEFLPANAELIQRLRGPQGTK